MRHDVTFLVRQVARTDWLALAVVLLHQLVAVRGGVTLPEGGALAGFAALSVALRFARWPVLSPALRLELETWGMVVFIAVVTWHTGGADSPLRSLYLLPIVLGFKSPTTERLEVPVWSALIIAVAIVLSCVRLKQMMRTRPGPFTPLFHIFLVATPLLFVISGAYIDPQSYRYLMPLHAALPAVYAIGIDCAFRSNRMAGVALLTSLLALFALQQAAWYRRLEPDREAAAIVGCLDRSGTRAAFADYWLSYKLTFLTGERVIVAPINGVDRYPPYTAAVRAQPSPPTIDRLPSGSGEAFSCGR